MDYLVNKILRELRDNNLVAEDMFELIEWIESPSFNEQVKEISEQLDCCETAAIKAAVVGRFLTLMRPFRKPVDAHSYNCVAKLAADAASWLLEFRHVPNAKLILAHYYDGLVGDLERRPGKFTEHHYEIFDDDENDYQDDDSALADDDDE